MRRHTQTNDVHLIPVTPDLLTCDGCEDFPGADEDELRDLEEDGVVRGAEELPSHVLDETPGLLDLTLPVQLQDAGDHHRDGRQNHPDTCGR